MDTHFKIYNVCLLVFTFCISASHSDSHTSLDVTVTKVLCEDKFSLALADNYVIHLASVYYGRQSGADHCGYDAVDRCDLIDVTAHLREGCDGEHSCAKNFTGFNDDPCPNNPKYYLVRYIMKPITLNEYYCENYAGGVSCGEGEAIYLYNAMFGYNNVTDVSLNCGSTAPDNGTECSLDVLDQLRTHCDGQETCDVASHPDVYGQPEMCPEADKSLVIDFTCGACTNVLGDSECDRKVAEQHESPVPYLLANCRKSFTKCHQKDPVCRNVASDRLCQEWADEGECSYNSVYMERYCARVCGTCNDGKHEDLYVYKYKAVACEGQELYLDCPADYVINIESVFYGRDRADECRLLDTYPNMNCASSTAENYVIGLCEGTDYCDMNVTNITFTDDPCPDTEKYISILYNCYMPLKNATACHHQPVHMSCDNEEVIHIVSSFYGRLTAEPVCPMLNGSVGTNCSVYEVKQTTNALCNGKFQCNIEASGEAIGNEIECADIEGYLHTEYVCGKCANVWRDDLCEEWARVGECEVNPRWMRAFCRAACWQCKDKELCENVDDDHFCDYLASRGDCARHPVYMSENCTNSCNLCTELDYEPVTERPTTNDTDDTQVAVACEGYSVPLRCTPGQGLIIDKVTFGRDDNTTCPHQSITSVNCTTPRGALGAIRTLCEGRETCWAPAETGALGDACPGTYKFLRVHYRCLDCSNLYHENGICEAYRNEGMCSYNDIWMFDHCFKACSGCHYQECGTRHSDLEFCDFWASIGECTRNPAWMSENCKTSCRKCEDNGDNTDSVTMTTTVAPLDECVDIHYDCESLFAQGECVLISEWMNKYCKKTCGTCTDEKRVIACEGTLSIPHLKCDPDKVIQIQTALFGRGDFTTCKHPTAMLNSSCQSDEVMVTIKDRCDGVQSCEFVVVLEDLNVTDPCPGTYKYLDMTYKCTYTPSTTTSSTSTTTEPANKNFTKDKIVEMVVIFEKLEYKDEYSNLQREITQQLVTEVRGQLWTFYKDIMMYSLSDIIIISLSKGSVVVDHYLVFGAVLPEETKNDTRCDIYNKIKDSDNELEFTISGDLESECRWRSTYCKRGGTLTRNPDNPNELICICPLHTTGPRCETTNKDIIILAVVMTIICLALIMVIIGYCCYVHRHKTALIKRDSVYEEFRNGPNGAAGEDSPVSSTTHSDPSFSRQESVFENKLYDAVEEEETTNKTNFYYSGKEDENKNSQVNDGVEADVAQESMSNA